VDKKVFWIFSLVLLVSMMGYVYIYTGNQMDKYG